AAVAGNRDEVNRLGVGLEPLDLAPTVQVPHADGSVSPGGEGAVPVGGACDAVDVWVGVPGAAGRRPSGVEVPNGGELVPAAQQGMTAVGRKGDAAYLRVKTVEAAGLARRFGPGVRRRFRFGPGPDRRLRFGLRFDGRFRVVLRFGRWLRIGPGFG